MTSPAASPLLAKLLLTLKVQLIQWFSACGAQASSSIAPKLVRKTNSPAPPGLGGSDGKESTCNAGDLSSIPGLGRSLEEGNGYPPPYDSLTFLKLSPPHSILTHVLNSEFVPGPVPGAGEITDDKVQP